MLIGYPHGLGDVIMLTPALRELHNRGVQVDLAVLPRVIESDLLKRCPYVEHLYPVLDPWRGGVVAPRISEAKECVAKLDEAATFIWHDRRTPKVALNCRALGVSPSSFHLEVFISDDDRKQAAEWLSHLWLDGEYGFVHGKTGVPKKCLPNGWGHEWLQNRGLERVVEVGVEFRVDELPINVQFEIMRRATAVVVIDSVFYHAAHAMLKPIDLAYFGKGRRGYDRVVPLGLKAQENVVFGLKQLHGCYH